MCESHPCDARRPAPDGADAGVVLHGGPPWGHVGGPAKLVEPMQPLDADVDGDFWGTGCCSPVHDSADRVARSRVTHSHSPQDPHPTMSHHCLVVSMSLRQDST